MVLPEAPEAEAALGTGFTHDLTTPLAVLLQHPWFSTRAAQVANWDKQAASPLPSTQGALGSKDSSQCSASLAAGQLQACAHRHVLPRLLVCRLVPAHSGLVASKEHLPRNAGGDRPHAQVPDLAGRPNCLAAAVHCRRHVPGSLSSIRPIPAPASEV